MSKFIVLHTLKVSPEEWAAATKPEAVRQMAQTMAAGKTPARCIKTWQGMAYGRTDYVFCLWEAEKAEDVMASLRALKLLDALTADTIQVDELDWAQAAL